MKAFRLPSLALGALWLCAPLGTAHADAPPTHAPTASARLDALASHDRPNIRIDLEPCVTGDDIDALAREAEKAWSVGRYAHAIRFVRQLEDRCAVAVGLQSLVPIESGMAAPFGHDTMVSPIAGDDAAALDRVAGTGIVFAVAQTDGDYRIHRSTDGGVTWAQSYWWTGNPGLIDVDAVISGNYLYIAYVADDGLTSQSIVRMRRMHIDSSVVDHAYGWKIAHDAAPSLVNDIEVASGQDSNVPNVYLVAREHDDDLIYKWFNANPGTLFNDASPANVACDGGLDICWNVDYDGAFLYISYIGDDGNVHVLRRMSGGSWHDQSVVLGYDGALAFTRIAVYDDVALVAYRTLVGERWGLDYRISYDGGASWAIGFLYTPGPDDPDLRQFDVTARDGHGFGVIYAVETGFWDTLYFRRRVGYPYSPWTEPELATTGTINGGPVSLAVLTSMRENTGTPLFYDYGILYSGETLSFARDVTCPGDVNTNGVVDVQDLLALVGAWGDCPDCPSDLDGDGIVDVTDMIALLGMWGTCP